MKIYCHSCGRPNIYASVKPQSCSCGASLTSYATPIPPQPQPVAPQTAKQSVASRTPQPVSRWANLKAIEIENDEPEEKEVPALKNIEIEASISRAPKVKLGEVIWTGGDRTPRNKSRKKVNPKKESAEFMSKIFRSAKASSGEINE